MATVGVGQRFTAAGKPFLLFDVSKFPRFSASFARGVGQIGARKFLGERPAERRATAFVLLASGVGNNPNPVSLVRGANGARRNAMPFRVIPDLGQVSENVSHPSTKQRCHVLQDREFWSNHANGSNNMPVESRTGAGQSGALAGERDVLAWEPACDDICLAFDEFARRHVAVNWDIWPMFREHALAERIDLDEANRVRQSCAFKTYRKSANTRE